jgi:hypothetical protein
VDVREVKDYFYFNYGSWWVYEEENSGKRDSVYVTQTYSDTGTYYFKTSVKSTYDGYDYHFWTNSVTGDKYKNLVQKSTRSTTVKCAKTGGEEGFVAEAYCFMFYPIIGKYMNNDGGGYIGYNNILEIEEIYNAYGIYENNFENVVEISEDHTAIEESQPTVHYYSPNVGLIKKELLDSNQVWNLVDYHLVK